MRTIEDDQGQEDLLISVMPQHSNLCKRQLGNTAPQGYLHCPSVGDQGRQVEMVFSSHFACEAEDIARMWRSKADVAITHPDLVCDIR
jgi:hypothetical protein